MATCDVINIFDVTPETDDVMYTLGIFLYLFVREFTAILQNFSPLQIYFIKLHMKILMQ